MVPARARKDLVALGAAVALLCALLARWSLGAPRPEPPTPARSKRSWPAPATKPARSPPACAPAANELAVAEGEAAQAQAKEERLSGLLAEGQERAAELSRKLDAHPRAAGGREGAPAPRPRAPSPPAWWRSTRAARRAPPASSSAPRDYQELATRTDYLRADRGIRQRPRRPGRAGPRRSPPRGEAGRRARGAGRRLQRTPRRRPRPKSPRSAPPPRPPPPASRRSPPNAKPRWPTLKAEHRQVGQGGPGSPRRRSPRRQRSRSRRRSRPLARRPLLDPDLHRDVRVRRRLRRRQPLLAAPAAPTRSCPRPGNSTAARASPRTPPRPNRTGSPAKSGPTPAAAPGSAP